MIYLSPKGQIVNECGLTRITWQRHGRGPELPKFKRLPRSVKASRISALGCVPLRKATVVATPNVVTIRQLQSVYAHTRARTGAVGTDGT